MSLHAFRLSVWASAVLAASLALVVCFVSSNLHSRFEHRAEAIAKERAILRGESYEIDGKTSFFPEFQNRVLFASVLATATAWPLLSESQWYLVIRLLFAWTMFFAFLEIVGRPRETNGAAALAGSLALSL